MLDLEITLRKVLENFVESSSENQDIKNRKIIHAMHQHVNRETQKIRQIIFYPKCETTLKIENEKERKLFVHNPDYDLPKNRKETIALLTLAAFKQKLVGFSTQKLIKIAINLAKQAYDMAGDKNRKLVKRVTHETKNKEGNKKEIHFNVYMNRGIRSTENKINLLRIYLLDILAQQGLYLSLQDRHGNPKSGNYDPTYLA